MNDDKKIKVLFVTHYTQMGGANHSMVQLIKELRDNYNVDPLVLAPKGDGKYSIFTVCKEQGIPYLSAKIMSFKGNSKKDIRWCFENMLNYPFIFYKLRKYNFDIVHTNSSVMDFGAYFSRWRKIKHVWHLREFGVQDFGLRPLLGNRYEKFVYGMGDCFIAISKAMYEAYLYVIPKAKMRMIYNGVVVKSGDEDAIHKNKKLQLCIVGLVSDSKNQKEAIKAASILKNQGCLDFHLNIIGPYSSPECLEDLQRYIKEHSLEDYVTFFGSRSDVPQLLSTMDVGLMLSKCEAFGRVTIEYMLQNLAVIVSDTGANTEIVNNEENGLIYPYGDAGMLAKQIKRLIEDRNFMLKLAQAGKQHALSHFVSSINTASVYQTYCDLLNDEDKTSMVK